MQNIDKAINALLEALEFTPSNVRLRKHVVDLMLQADQLDAAIVQLKLIVEQTEDPEYLLLLGKTSYQHGDYQDAEATLQQVISSTPSAEAYMLLSRASFECGTYQQAGDYYQEAVRRDASLIDPGYQQRLGAQGVRLKGKVDTGTSGTDAFVQDDIVERPAVTFKDVGGLEDLKENIKMNIIYPFQNTALFKSFGKKIGGGILLYGPPGCGKTFLARATAGECHARFINIAINDILDMYIGNSEKNLHQVFELARNHTPAIIFIDELDAIGGSRQQMSHHHSRMLTNQLLNELDGVETDNNEILVLGATNSPWFVDSSLRRPGRFDRILFVPPPDVKARIEILTLHLQGKPIETIDYERVAKGMEKYSGADIKGVCDAAADRAIMHAMKSGRIRPIQTADLLDSLKKSKPSTLEWLATAKNYATYSNSAGIYDEILDYLKRN